MVIRVQQLKPLAARLTHNPWHMAILCATYALLLLSIPRLPLYLNIVIILPIGFSGYFVSRSFWQQRIREDNRRKIIGALNHHLNNALSVIMHRHLLAVEDRDEAVREACLRMEWVVRQMLPALTRDMPLDVDPFDNPATQERQTV